MKANIDSSYYKLSIYEVQSGVYFYLYLSNNKNKNYGIKYSSEKQNRNAINDGSISSSNVL